MYGERRAANKAGDMSTQVLIGGFKHETNTFSVLPTDLEAYRARGLYHGRDVLEVFEDTNTEITGFLDICAVNNWTPRPSSDASG